MVAPREITSDNVICAFIREEETQDRMLLAAAKETASMVLIWIIHGQQVIQIHDTVPVSNT